MRILIVNSQRAAIGGVEKYLAGLMAELSSRGHDLGFAYEHDAHETEEKLDSRVANLSLWKIPRWPLQKTLEQIQRWRPECVFVHGCRSYEFEAAVTQRYASYLFAHDHQRTCPTGKRTFAQPTLAPCSRKAGIQCLACYYPRRCGGLNPISALRCYADWKTSSRLLHQYRTVFVASHAVRQLMIEQGLPAAKIEVLPPFNAEAIPDEREPTPRPFTNRIMFMGRLVAVKGADLLIRALPLIAEKLDRRLELVLAGEGSERARLEDMAKVSPLSIRFTGWLGASDRTELLRSSDLLAIPSVWPEPYGMVGIEAGAVGVPSVAFAIGGVTDWLQSGVSGELAAPGNPSHVSLADAAVRALADRSYHHKLRQGAWLHSRMNSLSKHAEGLESIWKSESYAPHAPILANCP